MKPTPDADYTVEVRPIQWCDEGLERWYPDGLYAQLNHAITVALLDEMPGAPWPPPHDEWQAWSSRAQAATHVFATTDLTFARSEGGTVVTRTARYETSFHTVVWLPVARYDAVHAAALDTLRVIGGRRITTLSDAFGDALREFAGAVPLSSHDRRLLGRA